MSQFIPFSLLINKFDIYIQETDAITSYDSCENSVIS